MTKKTRYDAVAPLFYTDGYKLTHRDQYGISGNVTRIYSNYTNRKSRMGFDRVVHFGLQAHIQRYLMDAFEPFFAADETEVRLAYLDKMSRLLGPEVAYKVGHEHIGALHRLGYLPLRFSAFPEGTLVPIKIPSWTVENTHPDFAWLTNYLEPGESAGYWHTSSVATIAHRYRRILNQAALDTGADPAAVDYQAHDFAYRGMAGVTDPAGGAAGHLLSFKGSDALVAMDWIDRYYGGQYDMNTIPATEHSVMSAGIASFMNQGLDRTEAEAIVFSRLLDLYPTGPLAVVSDTFNLWDVLTKILPQLKDKIMRRDGKLIIRPDSGDPEKILCGDTSLPGNDPAAVGVVRLLAELFGTSRNAQGFKRLDGHIGTIYGDGITPERAHAITQRLMRMGFVSTTVTFGVGSFSYQCLTRDSVGGSALKAVWAEIDGNGVNLRKDPVTDDGMKRSATGRLAVNWADDRCQEMVLIEKATAEQEAKSLLQPVWENGGFLRQQMFTDVRETLASQ